ncbi:hypothetical protein Harman_16420 [Haloarcula mannanilytica]|uniref:Lipoprotein n=1 Tax=Haloarcula mannanilytica TaxID=2509225 RepID=A0A4C2EJ52_9EURY|nr:hypothetical protein [Haloarcula mannanilytica]GCF13707.1 hypothetical protein Harman_16420 [Haloarcula mannanilytica]
MWRVTLTVAVALLAGCSGFLPAGSTAEDSDSVTPAPVPTSSPDVTVTVPTKDGTVDTDRLLDRHKWALANRSFHRRVVRAGPHNTLDVWVDRDADVRRVRQQFGPLTDDTVVSNGTAYHNVRDDPDTPYTTTNVTGNASLTDAPSGRAVLALLLANRTYRQVGSFTWNGRPVAVLAATTTSATPAADTESVVVTSRLYVDRQGIVRYIEHDENRPQAQDLSMEMTVSTDVERVPIPWWLAENDPYSSGSM